MTKIFTRALLSSAAIAAAALSGCASTPNPEKVCTSEWIAPRADRAVSRIETRAKKSFKALNKAGKSWSKGKTPGPLTMLSLSSSIKSLERELKNGRGMRDLRTLAKTCDDPQLITKSVRNLMERQGISEKAIEFIEALPMYDQLMSPDFRAPDQDYEIKTSAQNMAHH